MNVNPSTSTMPSRVRPRDRRPRDEPSVQRMVQFSDGVFTVALTLLVIDIAVPTLPNGAPAAALVAQLSSQVPNILAFALTFWVVGAFWLTHHRHFLFIRHYDQSLLVLNLVLLMTVCFIPWPTAVLGHYGNYFAVWALYAVSMAAMGLAPAAMRVYGVAYGWLILVGRDLRGVVAAEPSLSGSRRGRSWRERVAPGAVEIV
jgi:uncharacterized membrane protein